MVKGVAERKKKAEKRKGKIENEKHALNLKEKGGRMTVPFF